MTHTEFHALLARRELPVLHGLRAVFALVVVAFHVGYPLPGDLGVTAFFVLSGFLITRLLLQERQATGKISLQVFWIKRALRIFPAYYAFICLSVVADELLGNSWSAERLTVAVTYTLNYHNAFTGMRGQAAHLWSLAVEEQFYLVWPLAFAIVARRGELALSWALVGVVGMIAAWRATLYFSGVGTVAYLYNAFDTRADSLALGCLMAILATRREFTRVINGLASRAWFPLVTIALLVLSRLGVNAGYHYAFGFTVDSILAAILIFQMLRLHAHGAWRWLDHRLAVGLGTLSYPIYLWHTWALDAAREISEVSTHVTAAVTVALTVVLASGSYFVVERPALTLRPHAIRWANGHARRSRLPGFTSSTH